MQSTLLVFARALVISIRAIPRTHTCTQYSARARVKYRVVILGSLAEAWHCSREYRVERRLPGASANPSPLYPRFSLYVCLSFSSSLFLLCHYLFSSNVTSSSLFPDTSQSLLFSFSLNFVSFFCFCFSFCSCLPWFLKLSSYLPFVFICAYSFLFFVLVPLFLTRYIFKCISLCGSICSRRMNFFNKLFFLLFLLSYFDIFISRSFLHFSF